MEVSPLPRWPPRTPPRFGTVAACPWCGGSAVLCPPAAVAATCPSGCRWKQAPAVEQSMTAAPLPPSQIHPAPQQRLPSSSGLRACAAALAPDGSWAPARGRGPCSRAGREACTVTGRAARRGGAPFLRRVSAAEAAGAGLTGGQSGGEVVMAYFVENFWVGKQGGQVPPCRGWNGQGTTG